MSAPDPFESALERRREALNRRFLHAARMNRALVPEPFLHFLDTRIRAVLTQVTEIHSPEPTEFDALLDALYDISLTLVGRSYAGRDGRYPTIDRTWVELLPRIAHLFGDDPYDLCAAVTNAAYNVAADSDADAIVWLDGMLDCVDGVGDDDELLAVGQVLSWRAGMTHYRSSAIREWESLPGPLQRRSLGVTDENAEPASLAQCLRNPWCVPGGDVPTERALRLSGTVGSFEGFGGPFREPPEVFQVDGHLYARHRDDVWSIHADCFGATLRRVREPLPEGRPTPSPFEVGAEGDVRVGDASARFPAIEGAKSWAANEFTAAVTTPRSHHVFLVGLVPC